ncbi:MAG: cytochrome c biogenesis protein CcdA [Dehalococcoidia bacterium]
MLLVRRRTRAGRHASRLLAVTATAPPGAPSRGVRGMLTQGHPRSFLTGAAFSLAWSPCIGPILGVVLTLAATSGTAAQGALLLASYSLGLGLWFLAFGAFFGWLSPRLRRVRPYLPALMVASGVFFIVLGALMVLGEFTRLNRYFLEFGFLFSSTATVEEGLTASVGGWFGPAVAFLGGVVSFLSPCVLPLVPAYLVSIGGEAALGAEDGTRSRRHVLGHAVAFVAGFTLLFAVIGASAGFLGGALAVSVDTLARVGGVVLIVLGMHMSGLIRIPFLDRRYEIRV